MTESTEKIDQFIGVLEEAYITNHEVTLRDVSSGCTITIEPSAIPDILMMCKQDARIHSIIWWKLHCAKAWLIWKWKWYSYIIIHGESRQDSWVKFCEEFTKRKR